MAETKSVCVEEWLNCYLSTLNEKEQKEIQTVKSDTEFNFGMEKMFFFFSGIFVSIPCKIAEKSVTVETEIMLFH